MHVAEQNLETVAKKSHLHRDTAQVQHENKSELLLSKQKQKTSLSYY